MVTFLHILFFGQLFHFHILIQGNGDLLGDIIFMNNRDSFKQIEAIEINTIEYESRRGVVQCPQTISVKQG